MTNNPVYFDNSATTKVANEVAEIMLRYMREKYHNPSSIYSDDIRKDISDASNTIRLFTNAKSVYYTSGATESNNWVINNFRNGTIICSAIEHPSIINTLKYYHENYGTQYKIIPVDINGNINMAELEKHLSEGADLCSIMAVNNETGVINDVNYIYDICHKYNCKFHTDMTQAVGHIDIKGTHYDYASISSHKFMGDKGIGALLCNADISPFIIGGGQQNGMRGGTEPVASIMGMAEAMKHYAYSYTHKTKLIELRDYFEDKLRKTFGENVWIFNNPNRVPNISTISFNKVQGESLVLCLSTKNIFISTGSACHGNKNSGEPILKIMGLSDNIVNGAIRISFNIFNTKDEIDILIDTLNHFYPILRGKDIEQ